MNVVYEAGRPLSKFLTRLKRHENLLLGIQIYNVRGDTVDGTPVEAGSFTDHGNSRYPPKATPPRNKALLRDY